MNKSLALSLLACGLAAVALFRPAPVPEAPRAEPDPNAEALEDLARQTTALRADLDRVAGSIRESAAPREPLAKASDGPGVPPEVLQRLAQIEESIAALQRRSSERNSAAPVAPKEPVDLADLQRRAVDPRASEQEKLAALEALRGKKIGDQDAISHDVLLSMLDLAEHSQNEGVRANVYRNLHGVSDRALRDSMLRALAGDPSAKVRERAARDIDTFLPDVQVESALRQAADGDPDAAVRAAALKTLSSAH